ncbi:MAG: endopeptidase La [Myxococcota bacterium]|nr:endopeptidase La [Myxococcota bacterium]
MDEQIENLPILPLRNAVLLPGTVMPVDVGRPRSMRLLAGVGGDRRRRIGVLAQRRSDIEDPYWNDLHAVGTIARVVKTVRTAQDSYRVILQGLGRFAVESHVQTEPFLIARARTVPDQVSDDVEIAALVSGLRDAAAELAGLATSFPKEVVLKTESLGDAGAVADLIAANVPGGIDDKQPVLEAFDQKARVRTTLRLVMRHVESLKVQNEITGMVRQEMGRTHRDHFLRQQLKAIREELGEGGDDEDLDDLRQRVEAAGMPEEPLRAARKQLARLKLMQSGAPEYTVSRTYVDWLIELPWTACTEDRLDIPEARRILDEDHYDLEKVKKRILEHLAVRKLRPDRRGPILCFVGPPGVGKTSLGKSIARSLGRKFIRASLGGIRDEAEIRGHRRTYVGSLPGRILQGMKKAGTINPVFVLDEIDKLGADFRGDPAFALLEVLDPEQNHLFSDHYVEVPYDLSRAMFVGTANVVDTIPPPLLDRMEVIELPGYTRLEKHLIARHFLIPKQVAEHGLDGERLVFEDSAVDLIVESYTREAGVRNLEREVAAVCRAVAVRVAGGESEIRFTANAEAVREMLGPERFYRDVAERSAAAGVATGLAWTPTGGDIIFIEATRMGGSSNLQLTGHLGTVMKESAHAALSFVRSNCRRLGVPDDFFDKHDIHIHVPSGAIPKDGPSAGITMMAAIVSLLRGKPLRPDVAMTGELTLRGRVLPVGGIREKVLAAHRAGIRRLILPRRNAQDLSEIPEEVRRDLDIRMVSTVTEAIDAAFAAAAPRASRRRKPSAISGQQSAIG